MPLLFYTKAGKWRRLCFTCERTTLILQGLEVLDAMNDVFSQKKWRMEHIDEECKKWLLLLLELVNYDHNPETLLHEFISSQHYAVTKFHHGFIVDQVYVVYPVDVANILHVHIETS